MSYIAGAPRKLTPDQAKQVLTAPCWEVLSEEAQVVFPNRNAGTWSPTVLIIRKSGKTLRVDGRQWERCVVPLLQDEQWEVTSPLYQGPASSQAVWTEAFGQALWTSFTIEGYGPGDGA